MAFSPEKRAAYVALRAQGEGHHATCQRLSVSPSTVNAFIEGDPEYRELVETTIQAGIDVAEKKLMEAVEAGEPWAIKMLLSTQRRNKWAEKQTVEHTGTVTHELVAKGTDGIIELQRKARERQLAIEGGTEEEDIVDAEVIEDDR